MNEQGITSTVARFAVQTSYNDLPGSVIEKVKQIVLDSIGCALGGYVVDRSRIALELIEELSGNPQATIIGSGNVGSSCALYVSEKRLAICRECPSYVESTSMCKECGCIMKIKAMLPCSECPLKKWGKE